MKKNIIIAINGPCGVGKGTIAKELEKRLNLLNIDTGAMYRCVALYALENNIKKEEQEKLEEIAKNIDIKLIKDKVYLNNEDVTEKIRSNEVSDIVSPISNYIGVRESMLHLQRSYAKNNDIVMEGRDITTVVFPNATYKFYLDATLEERANRRYKQNKLNNISCTYEEVLENIEKRDYNDLHKKVGALKRSEDQVYIDTTNKTIEEVVDIILNVVRGEK